MTARETAPLPEFQLVEGNLRDSFRVLATARPAGQTCELPGVSIASVAVTFQMFNAAFLSSPVDNQKQFEERLILARDYFARQRISWSFWLCDSWLPQSLRRRLPQSFDAIGLRMASEMPGMIAHTILPTRRLLPAMEVVPVTDARTLDHFRLIGSTCFRVPPDWFAEVFDSNMAARSAFPCWVGYSQGLPVATAACMISSGAIGIYNIATMPDQRGRGFGEAITRFAIQTSLRNHPTAPLILQSTPQGLPLYERMGFQPATRILVFNSR